MLVFCNLGWAEGARTTGRDFLHVFQVDFRELTPISIKKWNKTFYWRQRSESWGWIREEYLNKPINTIYTKLSSHFFLLLKDMPKLQYFERLLEGKPKLESWMSFFWEVLMEDRVQKCAFICKKKDCLEKGVGGCGYGYGCYWLIFVICRMWFLLSGLNVWLIGCLVGCLVSWMVNYIIGYYIFS